LDCFDAESADKGFNQGNHDWIGSICSGRPPNNDRENHPPSDRRRMQKFLYRYWTGMISNACYFFGNLLFSKRFRRKESASMKRFFMEGQ